MIVSLLALSMLLAQPASEQAPPDPVATEAEVEVQVQAEAPLVDAETIAEAEAEAAAQPPVEAAPPAQAQAAAEAQTATAAAEPQEEMVCRRRVRPSERVGQRFRVVEDCRTRSEWDRARSSR